MNVVVVYESLTGNTQRAAEVIGGELERRGVHATVCNVTAIDYQALAQADLVVMGAYSHSRLRQLILGGVTRYMLEHAPSALLMAQ